MTIDKKVEENREKFYIWYKDYPGVPTIGEIEEHFLEGLEISLREHGESEYQRGLVEGVVYNRKLKEEAKKEMIKSDSVRFCPLRHHPHENSCFIKS